MRKRRSLLCFEGSPVTPLPVLFLQSNHKLMPHCFLWARTQDMCRFFFQIRICSHFPSVHSEFQIHLFSSFRSGPASSATLFFSMVSQKAQVLRQSCNFIIQFGPHFLFFLFGIFYHCFKVINYCLFLFDNVADTVFSFCLNAHLLWLQSLQFSSANFS